MPDLEIDHRLKQRIEKAKREEKFHLLVYLKRPQCKTDIQKWLRDHQATIHGDMGTHTLMVIVTIAAKHLRPLDDLPDYISSLAEDQKLILIR